jgi:hypothetical protein
MIFNNNNYNFYRQSTSNRDFLNKKIILNMNFFFNFIDPFSETFAYLLPKVCECSDSDIILILFIRLLVD